MNFEIAPKETEIQANWEDALLYCFSLNIDGKVGWRLPTKKELTEIYQAENDFEKRWYWSSIEANGYLAWVQNFDTGIQSGFANKNSVLNYVRAIRSTN